MAKGFKTGGRTKQTEKVGMRKQLRALYACINRGLRRRALETGEDLLKLRKIRWKERRAASGEFVIQNTVTGKLVQRRVNLAAYAEDTCGHPRQITEETRDKQAKTQSINTALSILARLTLGAEPFRKVVRQKSASLPRPAPTIDPLTWEVKVQPLERSPQTRGHYHLVDIKGRIVKMSVDPANVMQTAQEKLYVLPGSKYKRRSLHTVQTSKRRVQKDLNHSEPRPAITDAPTVTPAPAIVVSVEDQKRMAELEEDIRARLIAQGHRL